jgi:succinyl-CoA synthetase beta subunit
VEIEQVASKHPKAIVRVPIDPFIGVQDYAVDYIIDVSGIDPTHKRALKRLLESLLKLFFSRHATLLEINPLIVSDSGDLIALDAKMDIDDAALYKLPSIRAYRDDLPEHALVLEARRFNFLYIPVEEGGEIGVMSNGSGMLMSCIDLLAKRELCVGGALDLGGGSTAERICEAVRILLSAEEINTLFISIFGGITRCDEVARGVRQALFAPGVSARVVIRMEGTNRREGLDILSAIPDRVKVAASMTEAVEYMHFLIHAKGGAL